MTSSPNRAWDFVLHKLEAGGVASTSDSPLRDSWEDSSCPSALVDIGLYRKSRTASGADKYAVRKV